MPTDSKGKVIARNQTVQVTGKVVAVSEKDGRNVLVETSDGQRLSVANADVTVTEDAIRQQLDALVAAARRQGAAIAIGHPHDVTMMVLAQWLADNHGVTLVRLPEAMVRKSQTEALASR